MDTVLVAAGLIAVACGGALFGYIVGVCSVNGRVG